MCYLVTIIKKLLSKPRIINEEDVKNQIIERLIIQYQYTSGVDKINSFKIDIIDKSFRTIEDHLECKGCGQKFEVISFIESLPYHPDCKEFYENTVFSHVVCNNLHRSGFDQRKGTKPYTPPDDISEKQVKL